MIAKRQKLMDRNAHKDQGPRIVPRPHGHKLQERDQQKRNPRDPFDALGDVEIILIIELLPVTDTETLRRVSKRWKDTSESHCGRTALRTHFPWAIAKADGLEQKEVNLLFRRCRMYDSTTANLKS